MIKDEYFTHEDIFNNKYICRNGKITLRLRTESRGRQIGEIVEKGGLVIFKKKDTEKQIHRKTNSWSIPSFIWQKVDGVWIITEKAEYKVLKKSVENVKYLNFKNSTELKVYIPVDEFWQG